MNDFIRGLGNLFGRLGRGPEVSDASVQTFAVGATPTVEVHQVLGTVRIATGGDGSVRVEAIRKARATTGEVAQQDLAQIVVTCTQDGDTIRVDVRMNAPSISISRQLWCDLVITVPAATNLDLKAEAGTVEVGSTSGRLAAELDAGNLEVTGFDGTVAITIRAGNVELSEVRLSAESHVQVNAGQIVVAGAVDERAVLDLQVNMGRIKLVLPAQTPARLEASTLVGAISITGWSIPVLRSVTSARANGSLTPNVSATITAHVDTGEIDVSAK